MSRWFALLATLVGAGCATPSLRADQIFTPDRLKQQARALDGKAVVVKGWLPYCVPTACTLYESKAEFDRFQAGRTTMLSIARDNRFDATVRNRVPAEVIVRVRVNAICIVSPAGARPTPDDLLECIQHRPVQLIPVRLLRSTQ